MQGCEWFLLAFDRYTEELSGEFPLKGLDLSTAQFIFDQSVDNPMYDSYPVRLEHISQLRLYTDADFDTQKYLYFVECVAI